MLTEKTDVPGRLVIWAIPQDPSEGELFKFEVLAAGTYQYSEGAVNVCEIEHTFTIPAGINLVEKAIKTLETRKLQVLKEAREEAYRLEERIKNLRFIEYQPGE